MDMSDEILKACLEALLSDENFEGADLAQLLHNYERVCERLNAVPIKFKLKCAVLPPPESAIPPKPAAAPKPAAPPLSPQPPGLNAVSLKSKLPPAEPALSHKPAAPPLCPLPPRLNAVPNEIRFKSAGFLPDALSKPAPPPKPTVPPLFSPPPVESQIYGEKQGLDPYSPSNKKPLEYYGRPWARFGLGFSSLSVVTFDPNEASTAEKIGSQQDQVAENKTEPGGEEGQAPDAETGSQQDDVAENKTE